MLRYSENVVPAQRQDDKRGSWCILGVCLVFIFNVSLIPSFGILFEQYFEGDSESEKIVVNLFLFLTNLTILATGFLIKNLSAKNFVIIGSSITFVGLLLSSLVKSMVQLIFTFPILIGVGLGLLNPASFVALLSCFTERRTSAICIGFAALGFGQLVMPMIVKELLVFYGTRITLVIISMLSLIGQIGGYLLVPIRWKPCVKPDLESQPLLIRNSFGKSSTLMNIIEATDLDLLWNYKYLTIIFGLSVVYASSTNVNNILPNYLQLQLPSFDLDYINDCLFLIAIADITTRILYAIISTIFNLSSRFWFLFGVMGLGAVRIILLHIQFDTYAVLPIVCAALGVFRAVTVVNQVLILVDFCEMYCPTKLPGTLGLSVVIKSIMLMIFGLIFNALAELSLGVSLNLYIQICLFLILITVWIVNR